jgi:hypothetical protein
VCEEDGIGSGQFPKKTKTHAQNNEGVECFKISPKKPKPKLTIKILGRS